MQANPETTAEADPAKAAAHRRKALLARMGAALPVMAGYRMLRPAEAWASLGDTLVHQGRYEDALAAFTEADILMPGDPMVINALVFLLAQLQRPAEAFSLLERQPVSAGRLALQADLALTLKRPAEALQLCDQALTLDTHDFAARLNRGAALRMLKRLPDALANDRQLVATHPAQAQAQYNLGDALLANGQYDDALAALEQAARLNPAHVATQMARTVAMAMLRRFDEADAMLVHLRAQHPEASATYLRQAALAINAAPGALDNMSARALYLGHTMQRQQVCEWSGRHAVESLLPDYIAGLADTDVCEIGLAFHALLFDVDPGVQRSVASAVAQRAERLAANWQINRFHTPPIRSALTKSALTGRRLRIGFLSPDFRPHPVGDSHWRQFQLHDRTRFEIIAYSLLDAGVSPERERIRTACDNFVELAHMESEAAAQRIATDGIDILVDLSGYTEHTRPEILAARPAAIQVQHMGTPGSAGAAFIDYRISDVVTVPPADAAQWAERLVWLPDTSWLADETLPMAQASSRAANGLPEDGLVFCCFNTLQKLEPQSFSVWMRALQAIPGSVLWLAEGPDGARSNLLGEAATRGVDAARIIFAPRLGLPDHLARHTCADLFLDTFIYNAGVTAVLALHAGLPVLTCLGKTMASRMGASAVLAANLPELVANSRTDYEVRLLELATHPEKLRSLRQRLLAERRSLPLFQTASRVRHIERAYEHMWARHCAGLPAASFDVTTCPTV